MTRLVLFHISLLLLDVDIPSLLTSDDNLSLDHTLTSCGHVTHHLTLGVEAIDPYITTQVNGIHTIARHMDDERI